MDKTGTLTKNEMAVRYFWLLTRTSHIIRKLNVYGKERNFCEQYNSSFTGTYGIFSDCAF